LHILDTKLLITSITSCFNSFADSLNILGSIGGQAHVEMGVVAILTHMWVAYIPFNVGKTRKVAASGNKLLVNFNNLRFTILKTKFIKLKAPNMAVVSAGATEQETGSGFTIGTSATQQSRATKMFSMTIPGKKFMKGGIIQYENNGMQPKFFDYHLAFFAYSNYSTSDALGFYVARVNDAFTKLHYKDA